MGVRWIFSEDRVSSSKSAYNGTSNKMVERGWTTKNDDEAHCDISDDC